MKTMRATIRICLALAALLAMPADFAQNGTPSKDNPNNPNKLNGRSTMRRADASPGASVSEIIGVNNLVTINYHRPGIKGREVWKPEDPHARNAIIPFDGQPNPWRAGANENTTICFQEDVKIDGKELAAGTYGLFLIPTSGDDWTFVFSKKSENWGLTYDKDDDALRVPVKPQEAPSKEWLQFSFDDLEAGAATAYLHWGTKKVGFKIEPATEAAPPAPPRGGAAAPAKAEEKGEGKM
jgi:hypothetical protein